MEIAIPPDILDALMGGGLIAAVTTALLEWLKFRDWFPVKDGDFLIVVAAALGMAVAAMFWSFGWVVGGTFPGALGYGLASGLGASIIRDLWVGIMARREEVVMVVDPDGRALTESEAKALAEKVRRDG